MHQDESTVGLDQLAHVLAGRVVRSDGRADCDAAILSDLRRDVANTTDVDVAVFFRESKFGREMLPDQVSIEQGHRTAADFKKFRQKNVRDRRFSGA